MMASVYYAKLMDQRVKIFPGVVCKEIILQHDTVRPHTNIITLIKIYELKFDLLPRPPITSAYSLHFQFSQSDRDVDSMKKLRPLSTLVLQTLKKASAVIGTALEDRGANCIRHSKDCVQKFKLLAISHHQTIQLLFRPHIYGIKLIHL